MGHVPDFRWCCFRCWKKCTEATGHVNNRGHACAIRRRIHGCDEQLRNEIAFAATKLWLGFRATKFQSERNQEQGPLVQEEEVVTA